MSDYCDTMAAWSSSISGSADDIAPSLVKPSFVANPNEDHGNQNLLPISSVTSATVANGKTCDFQPRWPSLRHLAHLPKLCSQTTCSSSFSSSPLPPPQQQEQQDPRQQQHHHRPPLPPKTPPHQHNLDTVSRVACADASFDPPVSSVKCIAWCLVLGEKAESTSGYILIAFSSFAVTAFGSLMVCDIFWLLVSVSLLEVTLKLLRNWADTLLAAVKCADVPSQWDPFHGLRWSLRARFLGVLLQLSLYVELGFSAWQWLKEDNDNMSTSPASGNMSSSHWQPRVYELLHLVCSLLAFHWIMGLWVLALGVGLWTCSGLTPLLLVPGYGAHSAVHAVVRSCALGLCCMSCLPWFFPRREDLLMWLIDSGPDGGCHRLQGGGGTQTSLSSLTWYVHCQRHPLLRGFAAVKAPGCGLEGNWTLPLSDLIQLLLRRRAAEDFASAGPRVSPGAQKWVVEEIKRSLDNINTGGAEDGERKGRRQRESHYAADLWGLVLLEAVVCVARQALEEEGGGSDRRRLSLQVADMLFAMGAVAGSLRAATVLPKAGLRLAFFKRLHAKMDAGASLRMAVRLTELGIDLHELDRWCEGRELLESALKLWFRVVVEEREKGLNGVAWVMAHMHPISIQELEVAEQLARNAVTLADMRKMGDWDRAVFLDTLVYVLRKLGKSDEALPLQQKAVELAPGNGDMEANLRALEAEIGGCEGKAPLMPASMKGGGVEALSFDGSEHSSISIRMEI